jgi:hypothetical protein
VAGNIDLKEIERKAWMSYFRDGLLDIYLGLLLLVLWAWPSFLDSIQPAGLRILTEVGVMAVLIAGFWASKRFITLPRLGRAKFGPARQAKRRKTAAVYAAAVLLTVLLWVLVVAAQQNEAGLAAAFRDESVWIGLGFALMAGLVIGLGAYFMDFSRGYVHAVLYAGGFAAAEVLSTPLGFLIAGSIGLLMGTVVLVRFLHAQPVVREEGDHVTGG